MYFNEEHQLFRTSFREFLDQEIMPHIDEWEKQGEIPRWVWARFGEMGYFALNFPEGYGGLALDFWYQVIFLEEISRCHSGGFAAALSAHPVLALTHIAESGSEWLKEKYLRPGIEGTCFGALAITEPGAGSDVANIQTRAVRAGDHYLVKECAMAKLLCTDLSDKVSYESMQFLGGYGYMEEYRAARMFRDSRLGTIGGGTSEIMCEIIAKMLIDEKVYETSNLQ